VFAARALGGVGYAGTNLPRQLGAQTIGIAAAAAWSALATIALVKLVGAAVGVRVEAQDEYEGLDFASHGERAYDYGHSSARKPLRLMSREAEADRSAEVKKNQQNRPSVDEKLKGETRT